MNEIGSFWPTGAKNTVCYESGLTVLAAQSRVLTTHLRDVSAGGGASFGLAEGTSFATVAAYDKLLTGFFMSNLRLVRKVYLVGRTLRREALKWRADCLGGVK